MGVKKVIFSAYLAVLIGLVGCGANAPEILPSPTASETPTLTVPPTATFTPTPLPRLSEEQWEQQQSYIVALLEASYNNCDLPCLWGITPGKTIWLDAKQILDDAGIYTFDNTRYLSPTLTSTNWTAFSIHGTTSFQEGLLQTDLGFYVHNEIVDHVIVNSQGNHSFSNQIPAFRKMWENYSAEKLIPELGVPSRVGIYSSIFPGEGLTTGSLHVLYIFYDTQGILLEYTVNDDLNSMYKICPIFGKGGNTEDRITMILKSPDDGIPIENYEPAYNSTFLNLENAAGMTNEEFYKLFLQVGKPVCFNTLPGVLPYP